MPFSVITALTAPAHIVLIDYLGYLADRRYSPRTVRAHAFDLLAFCRWLLAVDIALGAVTAKMLLRYLAHCRAAVVRGRPGGNVYSIRDGRNTGITTGASDRKNTPLIKSRLAGGYCRSGGRPAPWTASPPGPGMPGNWRLLRHAQWSSRSRLGVGAHAVQLIGSRLTPRWKFDRR